MSENVGYLDTAKATVTDNRYMLKAFLDLTWMRRVLYYLSGDGQDIVQMLRTSGSGAIETKLLTPTLPGSGQITGITNDRRFLLGTYVDGVNPDMFCKWDFSGNLISAHANSLSNVSVYSYICFLRRYIYVLASLSPAEIHVYNQSGVFVNSFSLIDRIYSGLCHDRRSLWLINTDSSSFDNYTTNGFFNKSSAFIGTVGAGITFNRRYKLIGTT